MPTQFQNAQLINIDKRTRPNEYQQNESDHKDEDEHDEDRAQTLYEDDYETNTYSSMSIKLDLAPDVDSYSTASPAKNPMQQINQFSFQKHHLQEINRQYEHAMQQYGNIHHQHQHHNQHEDETEHGKKKYAKEAWPGRKPAGPMQSGSPTELNTSLPRHTPTQSPTRATNPPPPPSVSASAQSKSPLAPPKRLII